MVPKTRLEATDSAARQPLTSNENDMDASSSVLGKRGCSMAEASIIEQSAVKGEGNRSRGGAPATTMEVNMAVVPALKPKLGAHQSSFVE